jgi:hypothetical protein
MLQLAFADRQGGGKPTISNPTHQTSVSNSINLVSNSNELRFDGFRVLGYKKEILSEGVWIARQVRLGMI